MINLEETLKDNLEKLDKIAEFTADWNNNGAEPFSKRLIARVRRLLLQLHIQPFLAPTARHTIQIEYDRDDGAYLEFEIHKRNPSKLYATYTVDKMVRGVDLGIQLNIDLFNAIIDGFMNKSLNLWDNDSILKVIDLDTMDLKTALKKTESPWPFADSLNMEIISDIKKELESICQNFKFEIKDPETPEEIAKFIEDLRTRYKKLLSDYLPEYKYEVLISKVGDSNYLYDVAIQRYREEYAFNIIISNKAEEILVKWEK